MTNIQYVIKSAQSNVHTTENHCPKMRQRILNVTMVMVR